MAGPAAQIHLRPHPHLPSGRRGAALAKLLAALNKVFEEMQRQGRLGELWDRLFPGRPR
jgi:hypothetical protein